MEPDDLPSKQELQKKVGRLKVGLVFTPMNNFRGCIEGIWSAKSKHHLEIYIESQWIEPKKTLAQAWNDGSKRAFSDGCDYVVVCNDDILFSPDTIDAMIEQYELLRDTENVIMVTPNNIKLELANPYDILTYERPDQPFTFSENPNFSCFLIKPEYFDIIGEFDTNFNPAWFEDNCSHRRSILLGYKEITTTAAPQVHFGGVSTSMLPSNQRDSGASQVYYIKKWGGIPYSHHNGGTKEHFTHPYNNPNIPVNQWIPDFMGKLSRGEIDELGNPL